MTLLGKREVAHSPVPPLSWEDRIVRSGIVGAGLLTLALLAWVHLGLGAWVMPPAPTATQQVMVAGPYQVTVRSDSGQLSAGGPNTLSVLVQNQARGPLKEVRLAMQATMTSMAMQAPTIAIIMAPEGFFIVHPRFGMAGDWRLTLIISGPGARPQDVTFIVGVRWN